MESKESVEVTALSADEAIILGLTRMGVTRDEVDIEILDEGSRGFLGIGAREAVVRLTRRPPEPEPEPEPEPTPEPAVSSETKAAAEPPEPSEESETLASPVSAPEPAPVAEKAPEPVESTPDVPATKPKQVQSVPAAQPTPPSEVDKDGLDRVRIERVTLDVADHLFDGLRLKLTTTWRQEDRPTLWLSVRGRDANMLVGPRAQTLSSMQYLFRTLVHHLADGDYNLVVDADGYRKRRHRSLAALARRKADQATNSGRTIRLRPMPAHERRLIHMALRKDDRVRTESVGRGRNRAVTIIPVKKAG